MFISYTHSSRIPWHPDYEKKRTIYADGCTDTQYGYERDPDDDE
jgi:hypothetical protein